MANCAMPGCRNPAKNIFGVRLRKEDTTAIWAPNTEVYLCNLHASCGYDIKISLTPTQLDEVTTNVTVNGSAPITRNMRIDPNKKP